jgi:hypothetical protein
MTIYSEWDPVRLEIVWTMLTALKIDPLGSLGAGQMSIYY